MSVFNFKLASFKILLLFVLLLIVAQNTIEAQVPVSARIKIYVDQTKKMGPDEASALSDTKFEKLSISGDSYGFSDAAFWIRVEPPQNSGEKEIILFKNPTLEHITQFEYLNGEWRVLSKKGGDIDVKQETRGYLFDLTSGGSLFKVTSDYMLLFSAEIMPKNDYSKYESSHMLAIGFFLGIMCLVFFYNVFSAYKLKSKTHLAYCGYLFLAIVQIINMSGLLFQYTDLEGTFLGKQMVMQTATLLMIMFSVFAKTVLEVTSKWLSLTYYAYYVLAGSVGVLALFWFTPELIAVSNLIGLLGFIITLIALIVAIKNGHQPAYYYLIGWSLLVTAGACDMLKNVGVISSGFISEYFIYMGFASDAVFFSLSLSVYIKRLYQEREESKKAVSRLNEELSHMGDLLKEKIPEKGELNHSVDVKLLNDRLISKLSEREAEVIPYLLKGYSYDQIASQLFISKNTVKTHVRNIYQKIGVENRKSAMVEIERITAGTDQK